MRGRTVEGPAAAHLSRKDAAFGMSHVSPEVIQNPSCNLGKLVVPSQGKRVQVSVGQLGVVIQHLLKVGDVPVLVYTVSVKPSADLIVHAATSHLLQGECCHLQGLPCIHVYASASGNACAEELLHCICCRQLLQAAASHCNSCTFQQAPCYHFLVF